VACNYADVTCGSTATDNAAASGIFTLVAIAPMLPNHPQRFADLAAEARDRVIVDTYFNGDGARGRRSRALGIGKLYERLGYADWFKPGAERELLVAMRFIDKRDDPDLRGATV
jgi:hypothetical protein